MIKEERTGRAAGAAYAAGNFAIFAGYDSCLVGDGATAREVGILVSDTTEAGKLAADLLLIQQI